jgi:hypothetical protein
MTDSERLAHAHAVVVLALDAMRDDDPAEANQLFSHAVHDGVQPVELLSEIVAQTGGTL